MSRAKSVNKERVEFLRMIQDGKTRINNKCSFTERTFSPDRNIIMDTTSSSYIAIGTLHATGTVNNIPAVMKVYFPACDPSKNNSMFMEIYMYSHNMNPMVLNRETPHIALMYTSYECRASPLKQNKYYKQLLASLGDQASQYNTNKLLVLIMEKVPGPPIYEYMKESAYRNLAVQKSLLFQVLWTLAVFAHHGVRSNDLHLANILVSPMSGIVYMNYFVSEDEFYRIKVSPGFVKFIDFERASDNKKTNSFSKEHSMFRHWNTKNDKYDLFEFLNRFMGIDATSRALNKELYTCCVSRKFVDAHRTPGQYLSLCNNRKVADRYVCDGDAQATDSELDTPMNIIKKMYNKKVTKKSLSDVLQQANVRTATQRQKYFRNIAFFPTVNKKAVLQKTK